MSFFSKLLENIVISGAENYSEKVAEEKNINYDKLEIRDERYKGRNDIKEFVIPDGITKIGAYAFMDCKCLEKVTFPSTLKEICHNAFSGCTSLKEVAIPEGVTSIGNGAFCDCSLLENVVFPKSMSGQEISGGMFRECISLEKVSFPEKLSGSFANIFGHCESLSSFKIPYGVTKIGSFTFEYCSSLESVEIPDTVKCIEHRAFSSCSSLKEIYIPDSVCIIDAFSTFSQCSMLKKIRLPLGVKFRRKFDDDKDAVGCCFNKCESLKYVEIGSKTFTIEDKFDDNELYRIYSELALQGNTDAVKYVKKNAFETISALIYKNKADSLKSILGFIINADDLSDEELTEAVKLASNVGSPNVFDILGSYAKQRGLSCKIEFNDDSVRRVLSRDRDAFTSIASSLWPYSFLSDLDSEFKRLIDDDRSVCFIKYQDQSPAGIIICRVQSSAENKSGPGKAVIDSLYIIDKYRSLGFENELMNECEKWAKDRECTVLETECEFDDDERLDLCQSLGFTEKKRIVRLNKII